MKKSQSSFKSRRRFIGTSASLLTSLAVAPSLWGAPAIISSYNKPRSVFKGVQIGTITYSFRSMPDQSAEAMLGYVRGAGINAIELMGDPAESFAGKPESPVDRRAYFQLRGKQRGEESLSPVEEARLKEMNEQLKEYNKWVATWRTSVSMDKFVELKKMYQAGGVQIYGFKPNAFGQANNDGEIDYGFRAAKALGANHVTLEHPSNDAHTQKLGKMAAKRRIYVAYHGHEQQTPTLWDTALEQSKYNMLNLDLGHYTAAGNKDSLELITRKSQRISSMHLKDRQNPANGKANLPWGKGDTPIGEVLRLMRDQEYRFPATVELEYDVPPGSDAVKEVAKCLAYCRRELET